MKKVFLLFLLTLFFTANIKPVHAIVADHTVISQFSSIPRSTIETAAGKKLLFYHQSTGNNISYWGLNCLSGQEYDTAIRSECAAYIRNRQNNIWPYYDYPNWSWVMWPNPMANAIAKMDQFVSLVNQTMTSDPNRYQYFGMKFCYVDGYNLDFNDYRTKMENLETRYPSKKFIWVTDVLNTGSNVNNPTIQAFNDAVRNYIRNDPAGRNKPFLDLGDIESQGGSCRVGGYEVLCPDYWNDPSGDAGGHPDIDGSLAMAKGLWWLMANLNGTGPTLTNSPPSPTSAACVADINHDHTINRSDLLLILQNFSNNVSSYDINHDGKVNMQDAVYVIKNWGGSC